ncbi:hypothetical protein VVDAL7940_01870 [Vibrio vulnificus]|uniref:DUF262 domain-containing protein n=2 Tax=Vibrio vulnificus TaxID=672 RepID=UPI0009263C4C|nr:DUF262 domain-containing protein [Vibrio vulnificus]OJI37758.1 hypothetical protein VVDAL7940_01870 [Vibrio vulnificus]
MEIKELNLQVKNIFQDILDEEIDLKPEFQRGEVWTTPKKRLLIDSILRDWHIPPLHLVELSDGRNEVLDGQQRLTAIRDFMNNKFSIDGSIEPYSDEVASLDKLKYKDLPREIKRNVDQFLLKVYKIRNYENGEPNELFHRLNQTVKLTSAETRNSIFGEVRNEISELVAYMDEIGVDKDILGFSNSRMAYNDMLARLALILEEDNLRYQLSDSNLNTRYRSEKSFDESIINSIRFSLYFFSKVKIFTIANNLDLNLTKASSLSWLYSISNAYLKGFIIENDTSKLLQSFIHLETVKSYVRNNEVVPVVSLDYFKIGDRNLREIAFLYIERSSSRVMSQGSLVVRDIIINLTCFINGLKVSSSQEQVMISKLIKQLHDGSKVDVKLLVESLADNWLGGNFED